MRPTTTLVVAVSLSCATATLTAQQPTAPSTGWEITGIPALNFNSDEGFGYGAIVQAFDYGKGSLPYRYTIQPTLLLTTRGRTDVSVFFDAPHLLSPGWRLSGFVAREQQLATPYYGIGNNTTHDEGAEEAPNPYYYRFGKTGFRFRTDVQRSIGGSFRFLAGVGGQKVTDVDRTPFDSGTTLLSMAAAGVGQPRGIGYTRIGLVFDTRDQEVGPRRGSWVEALVQAGGKFGSTGPRGAFTRSTLTARHYVSPTDRVTLAQRVVVQSLTGTTPFYELFTVQGSIKDEEGLGGSATLRGWPKNRFAGKGLALSNSELRFRAVDFTLRRRPSSLVLSGFIDAGRVWSEGVKMSELASELHVGVGGGVRFAYGKNFVVAVDVGHSKESAAPIYIGLGYVF
jgi:outer membrane protein assembly factor BamA